MGLTKYRQGSIGELWCLSFPLMMSSFSVMFMMFVDRMLLAHYSLDALNAAVNATTMGWAFICMWMGLGSISEVFVAQYNGAKEYHKLGEPTWQMIRLSLLSFIFFLPMSFWGGDYLFQDSHLKGLEIDYFSWMMFFGPSFPIYGALCGFFIGQGKPMRITILALLANFVNIIFDVFLIFGIEGWIPSLGVTGAAIATNASCLFQLIVLAIMFLSKENRSRYGTDKAKFNKPLFLKCLRIGFPGALFMMVEVLGWAVFYAMMTWMGDEYITIAGISQTIVILFFFVSDGISKGATAIAGNLIGAKEESYISDVIRSGTTIHFIFLVVMIVGLMFGFSSVIDQFLPNESPDFILAIQTPLIVFLTLELFYLFFEGIRMLLHGVLTAAGDTFFLLIAGSSSIWLLLILPVYYFVVVSKMPIQVAGVICILYSLIACIIYYLRFYEGKWKKISIMSISEPLS